MTIGDILAVIAAVMLAAASWGATVLMTGLLFPSAAARAEEQLLTGAGKCFARGFFSTLAMVLVSLFFIHAAGPFRLISYTLWAVLSLSAALGSAGVIRIMAGRIDHFGTAMTGFACLTRATALYVAGGFVPIVGWFLFTPVAAIGTIGAGLAALRRTKPVQPLQPAAPIVAANQLAVPGQWPTQFPGANS